MHYTWPFTKRKSAFQFRAPFNAPAHKMHKLSKSKQREITALVERYAANLRRKGVDPGVCLVLLESYVDKLIATEKRSVNQEYRGIQSEIEQRYIRRYADLSEATQCSAQLALEIENTEFEYQFITKLYKHHNPLSKLRNGFTSSACNGREDDGGDNDND